MNRLYRIRKLAKKNTRMGVRIYKNNGVRLTEEGNLSKTHH